MERKQIQHQMEKLRTEMELVEKFNKDFSSELYEGIDKEHHKLSAYVGYFEEFNDVIKREQHRLESEVQGMKQQLESLTTLLSILDSLQAQVGVVASLEQSKNKAACDEEMKTLRSEYKMYCLKKVKVQNEITVAAVRSQSQPVIKTDISVRGSNRFNRPYYIIK